MIKRRKQNLGKRVFITRGHYRGRYGVVKGFRGDRLYGKKLIPYVNVYIESVGYIDTIPGSNLERTK